jgi:hypothetical protein
LVPVPPVPAGPTTTVYEVTLTVVDPVNSPPAPPPPPASVPPPPPPATIKYSTVLFAPRELTVKVEDPVDVNE